MDRSDIADILRRQNGLISREQLKAARIDRAAVRHALASASWQELLPGVYAAFSGPVAGVQRLRAAVLYAGEHARVTGPAACRAAGLHYVPSDDRVTLLLPIAVRRPAAGFVVIRRTARMARAFSWMPLVAAYYAGRTL